MSIIYSVMASSSSITVVEVSDAGFKPMLASPVELKLIKYPVLCTPKYDGIRCVIRDGQAVSRTLKPIPNVHIRKLLEACPSGLDGELILPDATFNATTSAVMNRKGEPAIKFYVFDVVSEKPYVERVATLKDMKLPSVCIKVLPASIKDETELLAYEKECIEQNYEGIMIRSPTGPYKFGRSTARQNWLTKLKRFTDAEATIVGFEELEHNENEKTTDALGHSKRSQKKEGKVLAGVLGAFVVQDEVDGEKRQFKVATGMNDEERAKYWAERPALMGKLVKYKFQESGGKDLPRFPVFLGIRSEEDI